MKIQLQGGKKEKEKKLNKMEASNIPEIEFKAQVIRMLKELGENFNKETASIKMDIDPITKNLSKNEEYNN